MIERFGVRGRLLLSFVGVSAFAMLAAATAMYSFLQVGNAVDRITEQRVPLALDSLELSRQVERIVAAAPELLAVSTPEQHAQTSSEIDAQLERLDTLLTNLKTGVIDDSAINSIEHDVNWLRLNIRNLDGLVASQISSAEYMALLVDDVSLTRLAIDELLAPGKTALDQQVVQVRRLLEDPSISLDDRIQRSGELAEVVSSSLLLHNVGAEVAAIEDRLFQVARTQSTEDFAALSTSLRQSVAVLEGLTSGVSFIDQERLVEEITGLQNFVTGRGGIVRTRELDLDNIANGQQLLRDSAQASSQLTEAVDQQVDSATGDIDSAGLEAQSVQQVSTWILIGTVVMSLVSSILIVWLYVGRNLIARLRSLSSSMLAIANGNLKAKLPEGGHDEISQMADALTVFRDTAIKVEESNLQEIQEARRRLSDAVSWRS